MPPGLGLFRAECGAETIHLTEGCGGRFAIELAALRQISRFVEVLSLKQRGRTFARIGSEDWRIDKNESTLIKKVSTSPDDLVPDTQDCVLSV
jgi:hypothetical protein